RRHGGGGGHRCCDDDGVGLARAARDAVATRMTAAVTTGAKAGVTGRMTTATTSHALSWPRWLALTVAGFAAFFGVWWAVAASGLVMQQFLPTPLEVLDKFVGR